MQAAPRTISMMPITRNQPQDFLISSMPAANRLEMVFIVSLLSNFARVPIASVHENFRCVLRNRKRCSRLRIRVELSKDRGIAAEMLFESINAILLIGVVGQELRYLFSIGSLKVLEQPHQPPWVGPSLGTNVRTGDVRSRLRVARVTERVELADKINRQDVGLGRTHEYCSTDLALFNLLLLLHQGHGVVVNGMRYLMTQRSSKLLPVFYEVKQ